VVRTMATGKGAGLLIIPVEISTGITQPTGHVSAVT